MSSAYPTKEITFARMFRVSFRNHLRTLLYSFACVLLLFLVLLVKKYDFFLFPSPAALMAAKVVFGFVFFFFFSAAVLATHRHLAASAEGYAHTLKNTGKTLPKTLAVFLGYVAGALIVLYGMYFLRMTVLHLDTQASDTIRIFLMLAELTLFLVFACIFFFSYPLAIIDGKPIKNTFLDSLVLSEKNKIGIFLLFFLITLPTSYLAGDVKIQFITQHHLEYYYDFLLLCFFVPLFVNMLLLIINDSKKQLISEE